MLLAGILGGMAWAAIPALLRTRFNTSEIFVSLMLVYIAQLFLSYLVHGPWRDPAGQNFPQSQALADNALVPTLIDGARVTGGLWIALGWRRCPGGSVRRPPRAFGCGSAAWRRPPRPMRASARAATFGSR
jgi:hypothetical protein